MCPILDHPIDGSTQEEVRDNRQARGDEDNLARMDKMKRNDLIDGVHRNGKSEDASNCFPSGTDALDAVSGVSKQGPQVGRLTVARIPNPITDGEYCCHRGL
jgi:hypothetical protein